MKKGFFIFVLSTLTAGCASTIESFYNRQVVQDQLTSEYVTGNQEIGTLAVTAQRRLVVANLKTGSFCSEPPPEAADSISTAIAAALKANISEDKNVNAELASNFARHVNHLYKRSHTVQMFRDATYHLCVNAVNSSSGGSTEYDSYRSEVTEIVRVMLPTLDKEIEAYYEVEKIRAESSLDVSQKTIFCNSSSVMDKGAGEGESILSASIDCQSVSGDGVITSDDLGN